MTHGPDLKRHPADDSPPIRIGALVPLSRPGWVEAGRHLLAGLELATREVNEAGGIAGRTLELAVRDTAADPLRAVAAVSELAQMGVVALAGEYHSVVARAVAAKAHALNVPFLCSSAVIDVLTDEPTDWVARIAPAQSYGWSHYADYLLGSGHKQIAAVAQTSVYWSAGIRILRERLAPQGGSVIQLDPSTQDYTALCDRLVESDVTAVLLLSGFPEPAVSLTKAIRADQRLAKALIAAPAGQPEFSTWLALAGEAGAAVPFLRYMPDQPGTLGLRVEATLRQRLGEDPSFVAFEGYDTIAVLAAMLQQYGADRARIAASWPHVSVEGTRGRITFSRQRDISVWQWTWAPVQIISRDPQDPNRFRIYRLS